MKKLIMILATFLLALSACTGGPGAGRFGSASTLTPTPNGTAGSAELQLLLGTFTIERTTLAVTVDQAKALLPLWQAIQTLSPGAIPGGPQAVAGQPTVTPDPEMQAQVETLLQQVRATMTPEQLTAIATVDASWDSALAVLQARGISFRRARQTATAMAAAGPTPDATTAAAGAGDNGGPAGPLELLTPRLVNELIELLEERISGTADTADGDPPATPAATAPAGGASGVTSFLPAIAPTTTSAGPDPNDAPPANESFGNGSSPNTTGPVYQLFGGSDRQTGRTLTSFAAGESAVYVTNGGRLTLTDSLISTAGSSSPSEDGSPYGLNAGVLADGGAAIGMSNSRVTASGNGAYGLLASGSGSSILLSNGTITTTGRNEPAAVASEGGSLSLIDVTINTSSSNSDALFASAGGALTLRNGTVRAYGMGSTGIRSAGDVTVTVSTFIVNGGEAAVIDGAASISLTDSSLISSSAGRWGVWIHRSTSGDDAAARGLFSMDGGSLSYTAAEGPLFYVTDTTAAITLNDVSLTAGSGTLVQAAGGTVFLTATSQILTGNLSADNSSSISITLENDSSLAGAIDSDHTAGAVDLTLDSSSTWNVTADSHLTCLDDPDGISGTTITNIIGNGHTVHYDRSRCPTLGSRTYDLARGGTLTPE